MEISGRTARQTLLFSLLVLIISMLLFPTKYGTELVEAPLIYIVYELVFYGVVIYLMNRHLSAVQLLASAGLCLIYRYIMGAALGGLIVIMYQWQLKAAVLAGMGSYLPAVLLHIAAAPFILRPAVQSMYPAPVRRTVAPATDEAASSGTTTFAASKEKGVQTTPVAKPAARKPAKQKAAASGASAENDGFNRAAKYIGEDGSVLMAAVVDHEGLLLGRFSRRNVDAEDWAPFALALAGENRSVMPRLDCHDLERMDFLFSDKRVAVACEKSYSLMVVSERTMDEVLNIRINQGLEMIRKYVAERYSEKLIANAEKTYV
ncbi:MAG: hypothetical protein JSW34_08450 [Candidatus Zixiibacteriota bacterium]|nr:MAG: hypothetical protein JSW34_08450 [candidate division Zixibacteria bacterium]